MHLSCLGLWPPADVEFSVTVWAQSQERQTTKGAGLLYLEGQGASLAWMVSSPVPVHPVRESRPKGPLENAVPGGLAFGSERSDGRASSPVSERATRPANLVSLMEETRLHRRRVRAAWLMGRIICGARS